MSEPVASAAPVAAESANSTPAPDSAIDTAALDAADLAEEAAESSNSAEKDAKSAKPAKEVAKKAEKALENRIKKLKIKVDGKETEESLDLDNDEELVRHLQMSKMGQKRAQEKVELERQVRAFFEAFEKDPFAAMTELGKDPNKVIDDYINKQMENARKTPEQIEREKLESELQRMKADREREKEEFKTKELERLQHQEFERYDMLMEQALTKSDLPKTPYIVKKIADYMLIGLEAGHDVNPEDVIPLVREEMHGDLKQMFESLPEEVIESLLGEQVLNKLRKRRVAKAQESQKALGKAPIQDTGKSSKKDDGKAKEKVSFKEFFGV